MLNRSRTYIANPPGATIKEQLLDRKMSQKEFAQRIGMSEKHISKLINGDVLLTTDVANRLEMVLGIPTNFWMNLEAIYREKLLKIQEEINIDEEAKIADEFPYSEMVKLNWVEKTNDKLEKVNNLRKFLEVANLHFLNDSLIPNVAYRRQSINEKAHYSLIVWLQKVKLEARNIDVEAIDIPKLNANISKIRSLTIKEPEIFCDELTNILAECGIAIVFLPHLKGSYLHGASFLDGNKIDIGLTVRGKYADKFWFSLFHELGHIIYGHLNLKEEIGKKEEEMVDKFARDTLIPESKLNDFINDNVICENSINDFANSIGIDPGIVVGRLQTDGKVPFNSYNNLKTQYEMSI